MLPLTLSWLLLLLAVGVVLVGGMIPVLMVYVENIVNCGDAFVWKILLEAKFGSNSWYGGQ